MKFKAIKPGMVIHCKTNEEAEMLMKHFEELRNCSIDALRKVHEEYCMYKDSVFRVIQPKYDIAIGDFKKYKDWGYEITEFSDLIEPEDSPMTAKKFLEWFGDHYVDDALLSEMFDGDIIFGHILTNHSSDEIIQKITTYEAGKSNSECS